MPAELAESIADAVGFRNLLLHRYAEIDDRLALSHLDRLDDLRRFTDGRRTAGRSPGSLVV